jgi:hypothetical protein
MTQPNQPARAAMLDYTLVAFREIPNPMVTAHANRLLDAAIAEAVAEQSNYAADLEQKVVDMGGHQLAAESLAAENARLRAELAQARGAALIEGAAAVAADIEHIRYGSASDYAGRHEALLRRMATTPLPEPGDPS